MEFEFTVCVPAAGTEDVLVIKVILPVELIVRLVNVLLLMFWDKVVAVFVR